MKLPGPRVRVKCAEARNEFKVLITFENGVEREMDLAPFLRGKIFEPLRKDPAAFRAIKVEGGTIAWENGADIDPDVLYYQLQPAWAEDAVSAK